MGKWIAVIQAVSDVGSLMCCAFYDGRPWLNPKFEGPAFESREACQRYGDDWAITKGLVDYRRYGAYCKNSETGEIR